MNEYDLNGNGKIDPDEREIMLEDRRRKMEDADAKRDAQRRMTWFALSGMLAYPFAILMASLMGYSDAAGLIADIATVYVVAASGVVAAYFGFNAMEAKK
jgi:pheromone shutdown protein TraB